MNTTSAQLEKEHLAIFEKAKELLAPDFANPEAAIKRLFSKIRARSLQTDEAFKQLAILATNGPANDYNGLRTYSLNLKKRWENEILNKALRN